MSSWRGRLKLLAAGGAWIGLCQLVFGYFGIDENWLTAVRIPGTLALLIAIVPESTTPVSEPQPDAPHAEFVQGPWQRRISSVAAVAGVGCFVAALVVAIAWGAHLLFWLMFGTTFLSAIALHFTTDREQWGDY